MKWVSNGDEFTSSGQMKMRKQEEGVKDKVI